MARLALFFSFFLITTATKAQLVVEREPIVVPENLSASLPVDIEQLTTLNFTFRDGSRHWNPEDATASHIEQSFTLWLQCFQDPTGENCNNCSDHDDPNVREIALVAENQCLPAQGDVQIAYSPLLTQEQKVQRDDAICSCYRSKNSGALTDMQFQLGFDTNDKSGRESIREERREFREREERILQTNLQEQAANRLITERFQMGISAGSYDPDASQGLVLGGLYTASSRGRQQSQAGFSAAAVQAIYNRADERRLTLADFTGENIMAEGGVCIPYPSFLASKQFPDDEDFYRYLDNERSFDWDEWSYPHIMNRLRKEIGRGTLAEALREKPEVRRLYSRVKFLYDNPVLKNILYAPRENKETKEALFLILKTIPRPTCRNGRCQKDGQWASGVEGYRTRMAEFLRGLPARQAAQAGSSDGQNLSLQVAVASTRAARPTSDVLLADEDSSTPRNWRFFCDNRQLQDSSNQSPEINFIRNIEQNLGLRDFENPRNDAEFMRANNQVCQGGRRSESGGVMDFAAYLQSRCRSSVEGDCSLANRGRLVGDFLRAYPTSTREDDSKTVQSLIPFLGGIASQTGSVTAQGIAIFNTVASGNGFTNASYAEVSGRLGLPSATEISSPRDLVSASVQSAGAQSAASVQAPTRDPNGPLSPQLSAPLLIPSEPVSPAAVTSEREVRQEPERQTATRAIIDELTSLRTTLGQETNRGTPPESPQVRDLNMRIAELEERLRLSASRDRLPRDDGGQRTTPVRPASSAAENPTDSERRVTRAPAAESATVAARSFAAGGQTAGVSAGGLSGGGVTGGTAGSFGGSTSGSASVPNFLSKYEGVRTTANGFITVDENAASYQQLRSDSENSILPITVSAEDFQRIAENDQVILGRYFDQVRSAPGEVVRLSVTAEDGRFLELFVVKNGNELAVVSPTSASDGRTPASLPVAEERTSTLTNLRKELSHQ